MGTFVARLIASIMFTAGSILLVFYRVNDGVTIFWALQLMGIPSLAFINFNISVLVPLFPTSGSFIIPFLHGLFSASGGVLLIMKLVYVASEGGIGLSDMAMVYACGTVIMHIQTFMFTPVKSAPKNVNNYSVYQDVS